MAGQNVIISRTGFTNELGWEIYFRPENDTEMLGDLILEEGAKKGMILTATPGFRCRRIEAGFSLLGRILPRKQRHLQLGWGSLLILKAGTSLDARLCCPQKKPAVAGGCA